MTLLNSPTSVSIAPQPWEAKRWVWAILIFAAAALLMLPQLGRYALWDDEANTALIGLGVWQTGDTVASVDGNLVAYKGGAELDGIRARYLPPGQYYLVAPFVGLFGRNATAVRLPFAIFGLATVVLLLRWVWRDGKSRQTWSAAAAAILLNVAFFLFCRQCRYYAPVMFFSLAVAYLYEHWDNRRRTMAAMILAASLLLSVQYLNYAALMGCLALDWLLSGRKRREMNWKSMALFVISQAVVLVAVAAIWNPMGKPLSGASLSIADRLCRVGVYLHWFALDELVPLLLVAVALPLAYWNRNLRRLLVAGVAYIALVAFLAPGPRSAISSRYLTPVIILGVGISILVLLEVARWRGWVAVALGAGAFLVPSAQGRYWYGRPWQWTQFAYVDELVRPQRECYSKVISWLRENAPAGSTVAVTPRFNLYPLMFHLPQFRYTSQYAPGRLPAQIQMPEFNQWPVEKADYVVVFDETDKEVVTAGREPLVTFPVHGHNSYRPEISLRRFATRAPRAGEEVRIYRGNGSVER